MSASSVHLAGELAEHARGRTLMASFGAVPAHDELPEQGALLVFGREFQRDAATADKWMDWVTTPGRLLILLPLYATGPCQVPVQWEVRRTQALAGGETELSRVLARERRYEIRGQMLTFERIAGEVVTAGWRRHPAAGLLVVTALPLWSLSTLDHSSACEAWLADLLAQAGETPSAAAPASGTAARRELVDAEWTVLLHLCTGRFGSASAALEALAASPIHHLDGDRAAAALAELEAMSLATGGDLTPEGKEVLLAGPYMPYARVLWRQHDEL